MQIMVPRVLLALLLIAAPPASGDEPSPPKQTRITIGKETTFITEPLRPDGYPDYLAALNRRMSEGVTPENNAAVPLAKALGPGILDESTRAETYRLLGIDRLPEDGQYLVSRKEMIRRWLKKPPDDKPPLTDDELDDQFGQAMGRPWSSEEFQIVAAWLAINEAPLGTAIDGLQRPRFYWPYVTASDKSPPALVRAKRLYFGPAREFSQLLAARSMRHTSDGEIDKAWADICHSHKLARVIAKGPSLAEGLVAFAIEGTALVNSIAFAHHAKLSAKQARRFQEDVKALPRLERMANKFDVAERMMFLDAVIDFSSQDGRKTLFDYVGMIEQVSQKRSNFFLPSDLLKQIPIEQLVAWNVPLRVAGSRFDKVVEALRIEDPRKRREAISALEYDRQEMMRRQTDWKFQIPRIMSASSIRRYCSDWLGREIIGNFFPPLRAVSDAEDRLDLYNEIGQLAFALAAYRTDHGQYPERLDSLVPNYLASVPDDTFRPKTGPIGYDLEQDAYILWTVGSDGIDEGGEVLSDDFVFTPFERDEF